MPLLYQLGPFQFHGLWGTPDYTHANIAGETRPGMNGDSLFYLGASGREFEIRTLAAQPNFAIAQLAAQAYITAERENPLPLVIGSVLIPNGTFKVLNVTSTVRAVLMFKYPGVSPMLNAGIVEARWRLLPFVNSELG